MTTEQLLRLNAKPNALMCAYFEAEDSGNSPALNRIGTELNEIRSKCDRHTTMFTCYRRLRGGER